VILPAKKSSIAGHHHKVCNANPQHGNWECCWTSCTSSFLLENNM